MQKASRRCGAVGVCGTRKSYAHGYLATLHRSRPRALSKKFRTFGDFYPFYLSEHANRTSRRVPFFGTSVRFFFLLPASLDQEMWLGAVGVVVWGSFLAGGLFFFLLYNIPT